MANNSDLPNKFLGNNDGILPVHPSSDTCMPRGDAVLVLVCYDRRNGLVRKWKGADVGVSCELVISPSIFVENELRFLPASRFLFTDRDISRL